MNYDEGLVAKGEENVLSREEEKGDDAVLLREKERRDESVLLREEMCIDKHSASASL